MILDGITEPAAQKVFRPADSEPQGLKRVNNLNSLAARGEEVAEKLFLGGSSTAQRLKPPLETQQLSQR
jgi:hypothetical protein